MKVLNFPYPPSISNYALLKTSLPVLKEVTVCAWASSSDSYSRGYLFSLATSDLRTNELVMGQLFNFQVVVKGYWKPTGVSLDYYW